MRKIQDHRTTQLGRVSHSELVLLLGGIAFILFGLSVFSTDEYTTLNKSGTLVSISGIHQYILGGGSFGLGGYLVWRSFKQDIKAKQPKKHEKESSKEYHPLL